MLDGPLFLLCLVDCSILLGLNIWFLVILSDLECDYINASSACKQLNNFIKVSQKYIRENIFVIILFQGFILSVSHRNYLFQAVYGTEVFWGKKQIST